MKVKISITLSEHVLADLSRIKKEGESRSEAIERILREAVTERSRRDRDRRDLLLINENASELNEEAEDVLGFQLGF